MVQKHQVSSSSVGGTAFLTQILSLYNCGDQKSISEHTKHPTLRWMDHNSSRPYWFPLLSVKNRNLKLQRVQFHQNWTAEDLKNTIFFKSSFKSLWPFWSDLSSTWHVLQQSHCSLDVFCKNIQIQIHILSKL